MTALALTITTAGLAAAVNAANTGLGPIVISQIALGSSTYTPAASQTALAAEIKRINTFGADVVADNTLHVTITDTTADTYTLGEVGLYTNTGVLFAVYSQATPILEKAAEQLVLLSADILLTSVPPGSVTIGDTDFMLPPATTTRQGVVELATDAEVDAGTDTERAVTPAGVKRRIDTRASAARILTAGNGLTGGGDLTADRTLTLGTPGTLSGSTTNAVTATSHTHAISAATDALKGVIELATDAEVQAGTDAVRAVTPAGLSSCTATETRTGVIELATAAEVQAGVDAVRAVTPAGLASRTATETRTGVVELATKAEAVVGTDTTRAVTAAGVAAAILSAFPVGSVYITASNINPATFLGGAWSQIAQGRTLIGVGSLSGDTYAAGATGGAARVTLTTTEMPAHNHGGNTGGNSVEHTHSGTTSSAGAHTHTYKKYNGRTSGTDSLINVDGNGAMTYLVDTATTSDGAHTHTMTTGTNSADHTHAITSQGSSGAHENRPPYLAVYFWQRTA